MPGPFFATNRQLIDDVTLARIAAAAIGGNVHLQNIVDLARVFVRRGGVRDDLETRALRVLRRRDAMVS